MHLHIPISLVTFELSLTTIVVKLLSFRKRKTLQETIIKVYRNRCIKVWSVQCTVQWYNLHFDRILGLSKKLAKIEIEPMLEIKKKYKNYNISSCHWFVDVISTLKNFLKEEAFSLSFCENCKLLPPVFQKTITL